MSTLTQQLGKHQNIEEYRELHWEGSFEDYLGLVREEPNILRTAYQRVYDMVLSYGTDEYIDNKKKIIRYNFFKDPLNNGKDAIYGLDIPLMRLVNVFKAAANEYGTEKRIILLHGPVGSSKSTIARLLKAGLESYSRTDAGRIYTFGWRLPEDLRHLTGGSEFLPDPMNEDPLKLVPLEWRQAALDELNLSQARYDIRIRGDLNPSSRYIFNELLKHYEGDWSRVMEHVVVRRLLFSEKDRIGIGTFQPKDEKNQDSTELTGDINYRKIAIYGSDSDPRAFNFDGEFCVANRGIIEFVEILKLDVAFLYDLLGATQERKIKPKKFPQTDIDEVILGHSVAGETPMLWRDSQGLHWGTLEQMHERFNEDASDLEVFAHNFELNQTAWTRVKSVFRHKFTGKMLTTSQKWGVVETTPNHSIYNRNGEVFYPEENLGDVNAHEIMAVRQVSSPISPRERSWRIDVSRGLDGLLDHTAKATTQGGVITKPCDDGWVRLDKPRFATAIKAQYDIINDADALRDLITVLVWYATEGHVNGTNGGIVITQNDRDQLERVRQAYERITTAKGVIDIGAKTDNAWRLYLGSEIIALLATHHCGELSRDKRLPDFLFELPAPFLKHALDELIITDGSRKLSESIEVDCSQDYIDQYFEYKTVSSLLASQVGTLCTMLDIDYSVYRHEPGPDRQSAYRIRYVSGEGKRGGRHTSFQARVTEREVEDLWVYDIECIGLHNFVCGVGNVVCHNTNEPEYRKLLGNEYMEALRDRTVKIDIPYITKYGEEVRIYAKDFNSETVKRHIAPHTIEMAAMWAVLTRLEEPKKHDLTLLQKLKLYDGRTITGYTQDSVKELRKETEREGLLGISPRYIQDKISNALVSEKTESSINPFIVLNELEGGLKNHGLINNEDDRNRYRELLAVVKQEYEDIVKNEVQRAISADEEAIAKLSANYIDNVKAYTQKERVRNKYTGQYEEPDERLMRSIEEKIEIPDSRKDDFRREIMNYIGALAIEGKQFTYQTNDRLRKALELKLFEDQKDTIKLTSMVSNVIDRETQEKIDIVKQRMIRNYGYNEESATDVLNFVASIFARGDSAKQD